MIKVRLNDQLKPVTYYQNYFVEMDEEGSQSMQFEIPLNDMYYCLHLETEIEDDYGRWLIKKINQLSKTAVIICDPDMDDWRASYHLKPAEDEHLQTKTIGNALNYIKPKGWTIANAGVCKIKRTLDLEKCTAYDLLIRAKTVYDVQYDIDTLHKTITVVDPYAKIDLGVYVTPELNQKSVNYKGDSSSIVTRLYCYGADDMTFADINNGKPYVENTAYKGKVISGSWSDARYTNAPSLFEDGKKKLAEMSVPTGAYTIDVVDLQAIDDKYHNLEMRLRSTVHCIINPEMNIDVIHRIVKKRIYPDNPSANKITLSNQPRTLEKMWNALKENVQTVQKDGMRFETEVKQTNKEITELAKKTDENTKGIQSVEQKITPEQLLISVSDSIKSGNKLDVTQVIIDLLGLTIKNGGIRVYDGDDNLVLYVDDETKKLVFKGDIQGSNITTDKDLIVGNRIIIGDQKDNGLINYKSIDFSDNVHILGSRDETDYYQLALNALHNVTMTTGTLGGVGSSYASVGVLESTANVSASYKIFMTAPSIEQSVTPAVTSDKRKKKDIHDINTSWIDDLRVVGFLYKGDDHKQIGLIAQDCINNDYADYFIDKNDDGYYSIRYGNILNALIKYCQGLNQRIEKLEGEQNGYHSNTD